MSVEELVRIHSHTTFWVLFLGFTIPVFVPIDPTKRITAPKYRAPRTLTPVGTVGIGGITNCIYSVESPGGYQMLGRTPLLVYDLEHRNPIFEREIVLFKPGDRIVFEPINHEDYLAIERNLSIYHYQIEEEDWTVSCFLNEG
jgi:allophanate hydrolase subunit 1